MRQEKLTNKKNKNKKEETINPPGAPDRTPIEDPSHSKKAPKGDPQPPEKKKSRL